MGEIGSGLGSSYPGTLDANATIEVDAPNPGKTKAKAAIVNDLAACILAIETELGVDPAGSKATVVARLDQEHTADGSHKDSYIVTVSGSPQTVTGHKVFASGIDVGIWGIIGSDTNHRAGRTAVGASGAMWFMDDVRVSGSLFIQGNINDTPYLKTKVINIGTWNMDTTSTKSIAHGLNFNNIRQVSILIRNDTDTNHYPIDFSHTFTTPDYPAGNYAIEPTDITMQRTPSTSNGFFDSTTFDVMGDDGNRGWITIKYV